MRYYFEWDPSKANKNLRKHKISFERTATVFLDAYTISIFDKEHSQDEDRWITIGIDNSGILLVIVHTFHQIDVLSCSIRMISARKATNKEARQYNEENL